MLRKKIEHDTAIDTSDLAAKKAEFDKLDVNKLTDVPTSLNNVQK